MNREKQKGFTLIELLVVIFIIGILAGVILPNFVSSRQRARDSQRKNNLVQIKNALRLYYNDFQAYPDDSVGSNPTQTDLVFGDSLDVGGVTYMTEVPHDPLTGWDDYEYCTVADGETFVLKARLENTGDSEGVDTQNASQCPDSLCAIDCDDGPCYYVCAN